MGIANFIPDIWANEMLMWLEKRLVAQGIANTDYQGQISGAGDSVKINEIGSITINNYTRNSTSDITWEFLTDAQKTLKIDQLKYFAFVLDDVDNAQSTPKVMQQAMRRAAYDLADTIDQSILALHTEAGITVGSTGSGIDITRTNILSRLSEMQARLTQAGVPQDGRWAVIPPWAVHKLTGAAIANLNSGGEERALVNGYVGDVAGFSIFESPNVVNGNFADDAKLMFGYRGTISFAMQVNNVEAARPSKQFVDLVKGLAVYGYKVVRPDALAVLTADYTADST